MTRDELKYYGVKVTQASGTELVVLMYEIAGKYLKEAEEYQKKGLVEEFRGSVSKAKTFINELSSCLNMNYPVSFELRNIYSFLNRELVKSGINGDVSDFPRYIGILDKLRKSFEQIMKDDTRGPLMENTQQVYAGLTYSRGSLNENTYADNTNRGFKV